MDRQLAIRMLDFIEKMNVENLTLRTLLQTLDRNANTEHIDSLVEEARRDPAIRNTVHAQWLPLRRELESDSTLEEALHQFLRIVPVPKHVN
jgi:hypothetical protein